MGGAAVFGLSQFWQMLSSTQGVSITWFAAMEVFMLLNIWLSWHAHKAQPSLVTGQTFVVYAFYGAMIGLDLAVIVTRSSWTWSLADTWTTEAVTAGVAATLVVAALQGQFVGNPLVKGWLAVFFKSVPQLVLAWNIHVHGGSGLALGTVIAGHVTAGLRLVLLFIAIREAGWDKNRIGSFISEVPNELSWIAVTVVWAL
jgi:hypothetical protein